MMVRMYVFWFIWVVYLLERRNCQTIEDTTRLHDTLMTGYNKNVRPAFDQSKPVVVNVSFDLVSIRELDAIMGKLSIVGMLWMRWEEPRMAWNPFAYNNTFTIRVPIKEAWKPDLVIAYPVETTKSVGFDHYWYPMRFFYNGTAVWAPGDVMTTTCNIDVTYYPFDTQICEVVFMPWGAVVTEMYLHPSQKEVSLRHFTGNGEWSVEKAEAKATLIGVYYPTYTIVLELKRRPTFIIVNVVLPIMFMGFLNVLVFCLPPQSGERISFAITVLLAIAVFLTLVGDNMPKSSQPMSTICYFLLTNLVLSSLIMVVTILNLNVYHKDSSIAVPKWLAALVQLSKCKRLPKRTKIQPLKGEMESDDAVDATKAKADEFQLEKWALPPYLEEEQATWQDVSRMIDIVFGTTAVLWLVFTAVSFFLMVATHNVPGAK